MIKASSPSQFNAVSRSSKAPPAQHLIFQETCLQPSRQFKVPSCDWRLSLASSCTRRIKIN